MVGEVGVSALSSDEQATLYNCERMLEVLIDSVDELRLSLITPRQAAVVSTSAAPGAPLTCRNCGQVQGREQLRDGRCFVCEAPLG